MELGSGMLPHAFARHHTSHLRPTRRPMESAWPRARVIFCYIWILRRLIGDGCLRLFICSAFQELERNDDDVDGHDDAAPGQTVGPFSGGIIKNVN